MKKNYIAASNQELGSWLHSFAAETNIDRFIYLICTFSLEFYPKLKVQFRVLMFPYVRTALWLLRHFY